MSELALTAKKAIAALAIMVYHKFPDAEVVASDSLLRMFPEILKGIKYDGIERIKFINSGPLRLEDWMEEFGTIDSALLRGKRVVPVDCGHNLDPWDQHGQQDCRRRASIGRIIEDAADAGADVTWCGAFVDVIEGNDLDAEDMAILGKKDKDPRWPNVALQFRNFLTGLNLMMPDEPEKVLMLGNMACNGLLSVLRERMLKVEPVIEAKLAEVRGDAPPKLLNTKELVKWRKRCPDANGMRSDLEKIEVKKLFGWEQVLTNVRALYAGQPEYIKYFEQMADAAFAACQREWDLGDKDYWSDKTRMFNGLRVNPLDFDVKAESRPAGHEDRLNLLFGFSTSKWFGKVCRRGNVPEYKKGKIKQERPHTDQPVRHKSDIICQIFETGPDGTKFLVSTRGDVTLRPLAFQLRQADLRKKYYCLETEREGRLKIRVDTDEAAGKLAQKLKANSRIPGLNFRADRKFVHITRNRSVKISHIAQLVQRHGVDHKSVIVIDRKARDQLADSGNNLISVHDANWDVVDIAVMYFADFLSSFGNAHNTNPDAIYSALTPEEIRRIVLWVMNNSARQADRRAERRSTEQQPAAQAAE